MEVYLVRHGRTMGNDARRHQHLDTPLNEKGILQAKAVAEKIAVLKPTHLISSTKVRALLSAGFVAQTTNLIPETYALFEELRQPNFLVGERLIGYKAFTYILLWFVGHKKSSMHDGETYEAFVARLAQARVQLEELPATARVVIVSHSVFITFFTEHMRRPARMGFVRAGILFIKLLTLRNSSITHVRYIKPIAGQIKRGKTGWGLVRR